MNDTRLTAYALGELDTPQRETFEHELAASTELQAELDEIIALAEALPATLDSGDSLSDAQRSSLRQRCADNRRAFRRETTMRRRLFFAGIGAIAAGLIATAIVLSNKHDAPHPAPAIAAVAPVKPAPPIAKPAAPPIVAAAPTPNPQVADRLSEAKKFLARGSYDLAAVRYKAALAMEPANSTALQGMKEIAGATEKPSNEIHALLARTEPVTVETAPRQIELESNKLANRAAKGETPTLRNNIKMDLAKNGTASPDQHVYTDGVSETGISDASTFNANASGTGAATLSGGNTYAGAVTVTSGAMRISGNRSGASTFVGGLASEVPATRELYAANGESNDDRKFTVRLQYGIQREDYDVPQKSTPGSESYTAVRSNPFLDVLSQPLSTFSIDVDTASYANIRRFLTDGQLPPPDAVRIEELVNYFPYDYPQPDGDAPFSVNTEVSRAPWDSDVLLARVALKGRDIPADKLPPSNLVFLIDVSGSMASENKLPLLQRSLAELVKKLSPNDHVAIVTYAGDSGIALRSTSGEDKARILRAIRSLDAGGSTNGAAGIELAYEIAKKNFIAEGNNRVILCTDGDFNVGVTSMDALTRIIERERKSNVFLSVLGFGTGNLKDSTMEMLADKGNGNYAYIDTFAEGRKVLVEQMHANLFTIAKDVKIQIEFNPATVAGYRLIGYENRLLAKEDFNNDKKDAGEIGAGHTVTALYEIVPAGQSLPSSVDPLKYQPPVPTTAKPETARTGTTESPSTDLFTVKLRYKEPDGDKSKLIEKAVGPKSTDFESASQDFRFATAVAAFGMKLRADNDDPTLDWNEIQEIARATLGEDPESYRAEFLTLVQKAKQLSHGGEDYWQDRH